mmetsp:Transcript_36041/g.41426  ORF Transcript_36041/g.41426 Transcript_36041/m.41426 type:complete len:176 (-) Transcript_36041:119-646(-)
MSAPATAHLTNHPQYQLVFEALFRKKHMPLPDKRKMLHGISSKIETTTQVESLFTGQSIRPMKEVFKMVLTTGRNLKERERKWTGTRVANALSIIYISMLMRNDNDGSGSGSPMTSRSIVVAYNALKAVVEKVRPIVEAEAAERVVEKAKVRRSAANAQRGFRIQDTMKFDPFLV